MWVGCEKILLNELGNHNEDIRNKIQCYLEEYDVQGNHVWLDDKTSEIFSIDTSYANDKNSAFLTMPNDFLENEKYGPKSLYFKPYVDDYPTQIDNEIAITNSEILNKYKDSKILIIGAGPSAYENQDLWRSQLGEYDFVWSCNHYFKANFLKDIKFDLVTIGNEVDYLNRQLTDRIRRDGTIVGIETNISRQGSKFKNFLSFLGKNKFFFVTRYFGKIGSIPRMIVLAQKLNVKHISFVGVDGVAPPDEINKVKATVFENKKASGPTNYNLCRKQYVLFWDYVLNYLDSESKMTFFNYGKSYKHNITKDIPERERK